MSIFAGAVRIDDVGRNEVVLQNSTTGKKYTPADYRQLLADAGLQRLRPMADYYIGFVEFDDPAHFPYVDVYAERGSNIPTQIGAVLPNLTIGQVIDPNTQLILAPGGYLKATRAKTGPISRSQARS